jgi:hypothetical protein
MADDPVSVWDRVARFTAVYYGDEKSKKVIFPPTITFGFAEKFPNRHILLDTVLQVARLRGCVAFFMNKKNVDVLLVPLDSLSLLKRKHETLKAKAEFATFAGLLQDGVGTYPGVDSISAMMKKFHFGRVSRALGADFVGKIPQWEALMECPREITLSGGSFCFINRSDSPVGKKFISWDNFGTHIGFLSDTEYLMIHQGENGLSMICYYVRIRKGREPLVVSYKIQHGGNEIKARRGSLEAATH